MYEVIYCKKSVKLKIVYNKKQIQIFGMNMPFISSSVAKNAYFMSGEARNELNIFSPLMKYAFFASLDEINDIFIPKI